MSTATLKPERGFFMNKKLRFLVIPALALVFGLAFAGCGNDATNAAGGDDPSGAPVSIKVPANATLVGTQFQVARGGSVVLTAETTDKGTTNPITYAWEFDETNGTVESTVATLPANKAGATIQVDNKNTTETGNPPKVTVKVTAKGGDLPTDGVSATYDLYMLGVAPTVTFKVNDVATDKGADYEDPYMFAKYEATFKVTADLKNGGSQLPTAAWSVHNDNVDELAVSGGVNENPVTLKNLSEDGEGARVLAEVAFTGTGFPVAGVKGGIYLDMISAPAGVKIVLPIDGDTFTLAIGDTVQPAARLIGGLANYTYSWTWTDDVAVADVATLTNDTVSESKVLNKYAGNNASSVTGTLKVTATKTGQEPLSASVTIIFLRTPRKVEWKVDGELVGVNGNANLFDLEKGEIKELEGIVHNASSSVEYEWASDRATAVRINNAPTGGSKWGSLIEVENVNNAATVHVTVTVTIKGTGLTPEPKFDFHINAKNP